MSNAAEKFDLDNPKLPKAIEERALTSGDYPYEKRLDKDECAETLERLQVQLVSLQAHLQKSGERVVLLFEGRDAAGKGGAIKTYTRVPQPALQHRGGAAQAERPRELAVVFPALRRLDAGRRRDRALRPLLVQPRRRRKGDGLLHPRSRPSLSARGGAALRVDAGQ